MKLVVSAFFAFTLIAAPALAAESKPSAKKRLSPGTVYYVNPELGRVHVVDHQHRLFVVSLRDLQHRNRGENDTSRTLRSGDPVWFRTVAGS